MSKISLEPNTSGSGTFTLAAPNSDTNRTLTLPDEAGVVLTDDSDLAADKLTGDIAADRMKDGFNATGSAPIYACRAWVNFDGVSGPTIRASGNVSSVTRNGTGEYTVNFATAMPDTDYSWQLQSAGTTFSAEGQRAVGSFRSGTTTSIQYRTEDSSSARNARFAQVAIFR